MLETGFESERDVLLLIIHFDFTGWVYIQSLLGYNSFVHCVFECPRPVQIGPCALERKLILNTKELLQPLELQKVFCFCIN